MDSKNSMLSAIQARRGGAGAPSPEMPQRQAQGGEEQGEGMTDLVGMLNPDQKSELLQLLTQEQEGGDDIQKGGASSNEKREIAAKASESGSGLSEDESDDIALGMVDRGTSQRLDAGAKPRELGDRAKMYAAKKLKGKGKL